MQIKGKLKDNYHWDIVLDYVRHLKRSLKTQGFIQRSKRLIYKILFKQHLLTLSI